jgi:hypothetical protein
MLMREQRHQHDLSSVTDSALRAQIDQLCKTYNINEGDRWEKDLAFEVTKKLYEEERSLTETELRTVLLKRWVDAFYPLKADAARSRLAEEHVLEPIQLTSLKNTFIENENLMGAYGDLFPESIKSLPSYRMNYLNASLYGTDIFLDVQQAGVWVKAPLEKVRLVGSSKFSCCSALVGISDDGHLCYAHIAGPGSFTAREVVPELLEQKFGSGNYMLVAPDRKFVEGADPRKIEDSTKLRSWFESIAKDAGIKLCFYTEMYPDDESVLHDTRQSFAICATADGVQAYQTRQIGHGKTRGGWREQNKMELEIKKEFPEVDLSFTLTKA